MKSTAKDVLRPTATSIMRFLALTKKRHLILTGSRKAGKSTLFNEILTLSENGNVPRITTWARPKEAVYLREELTGEIAVIGTYDESVSGEKNKMTPNATEFLKVGLPALKRCIESQSLWIAIDEIGYLESSCKEYCDKVLELMDKKRIVAVIRKQDTPFLNTLCGRDDVCIIDLDKPYGNLGCVIMASGEGKRFGSNKLMADFNGKPLIQYALDATDKIFAKRVVVTRHESVASLCREQGVPAVLHNMPYRSDTVRLGIQEMDKDIEGCIFCMGDQPLLTRDTVEVMAMIGAWEKNTIWRAAWGESEGAPILFPKQTFLQLENLPQGKGGAFIAKENPELVCFVPVGEHELKDIDNKEDLIRLEKFAIK